MRSRWSQFVIMDAVVMLVWKVFVHRVENFHHFMIVAYAEFLVWWLWDVDKWYEPGLDFDCWLFKWHMI
jgi:hypothetical protein